MSSIYRKTIRHYEQDCCAHELTFSCYDRKSLLTNNAWRCLLAKSITDATVTHRYSLLAFVFMPNHVHLLVLPQHRGARVSDLLKAIKRPYAYQIKKILESSRSPLLETLTVRRREGVNTFRYWQYGPGYDRNLDSPQAIEAAISYIHLNPVRRGLCQRAINWKWSSARHFLLEDSPIDPDLPRIDPLPKDLLE